MARSLAVIISAELLTLERSDKIGPARKARQDWRVTNPRDKTRKGLDNIS